MTYFSGELSESRRWKTGIIGGPADGAAPNPLTKEWPMSSAGSVTYWIVQLKHGEREGATHLWQRYYCLLMERAGSPRGADDEEDIVLTAFDKFCRAAEQGRFPRLDDRNDLWQLLLLLTDREAINHRRRVSSVRRGGGRVLDEGALSANGDSPLGRLASREPTPEDAAQLAEECRRLFGALRDPDLEAVAQLKMECYSLEEIAAKLGCVPRTIQRRVNLIRQIWTREGKR
jgi:DNA-directed RNA polymerase specialized sigma24 family protein